MPRLDPIYQSRRVTPTTLTEAPLPASSGSFAPLISGSREVASEANQLLSLALYRESRLQELEQTNAAGQVLMLARTQVEDLLDRLRDPGDAEFGSLQPNDKKLVLRENLSRIYQSALTQGQQLGNIGMTYLATHLPATLSSYWEGFRKEMDTIRREQAQYGLQTQLANLREWAISAPPGEEQKYLTYAAGLLQTSVDSGVWSNTEARAALETLTKEVRLERTFAQLKDHPEVIYEKDFYTRLDTLPLKDKEAILGALEKHLALRQREHDRQEREQAQARAALSAYNRKRGEELILNKTLPDEIAVLGYAHENYLSATDQTHLLHLVHAVREHTAKASEKDLAADLFTRILSFDPKNRPTADELLTYVQENRLTLEDFKEFSRKLYELQEKDRTQVKTLYDKEAAEGEQLVKSSLAPFVGGLMDFDKMSAFIQSVALQTYIEMVTENRDKPGAKRPLDVARIVIQDARRQLISSGRSLLDAGSLGSVLRTIPELQRGGVVSSEAWIRLYKERKIDKETFHRFIRYLQAFEQHERALAPSPSPGETEGGRGRKKPQ